MTGDSVDLLVIYDNLSGCDCYLPSRGNLRCAVRLLYLSYSTAKQGYSLQQLLQISDTERSEETGVNHVSVWHRADLLRTSGLTSLSASSNDIEDGAVNDFLNRASLSESLDVIAFFKRLIAF